MRSFVQLLVFAVMPQLPLVTGRSKGYAFVEFKHRRDAESAFVVSWGEEALQNYAPCVPQKAHKAMIDDVQILVEYECERSLRGWIPRRFGEPHTLLPVVINAPK